MAATVENLIRLSYDRRKKHLGKSKYKNVYLIEFLGDIYYKASISKYQWVKHFLDEREAAKAVDIKLIEHGEKPINILNKI